MAFADKGESYPVPEGELSFLCGMYRILISKPVDRSHQLLTWLS